MIAPLKLNILILGVLFLGLGITHFLVPGGVPDGVAFAAAAISLFGFGSPLRDHAVRTLKRFRMTPRTFLWLASCVAFWYSTVIWIWWSRRSPSFPLFLLSADLQIRLFFDWVPVLVATGLALELRIQNREQRADSRGIV
jgi:cation transport ATPase